MSAFGQQNQRIHKTPIGYIDSAHLDGADGSDVQQSWSTNLPDLTQLLVGTAFSTDLATVLLDPGSPNCELGFYIVSGTDPISAGFIFTGTILSNSNPRAVNGTFQLVAIRNGISKLSNPLQFSISSPSIASDSVAPTIPTGITVAAGSAVGTIALTFDAPSDTAPPNAPASGVVHVDAFVNGALASPPSPMLTPTNALVAPTLVNIGTISSPDAPSASQDNKTWTLTAAGTGIAATTAEQCGFLDYGTFTGAQRFIAKLNAYTGSTTALMGLMLHETAVSGGKFLAIGLRPSNGTVGLFVESRAAGGGTSTQVASVTKDINGQSIVSAYVKVERSANNATLTVSYSLNELGWVVITTQTLSMNSAVHYGLFITSQSAGTDAVGTISEVSLNNSAPIIATITAAGPVPIALQAVDANGNTSAMSTSIIGSPKVASVTPLIWKPGVRVVIGQIGGYGGTGAAAITTAVNALKAEALIVDNLNTSKLVIGFEICLRLQLLFPVSQGDWGNSQAISLIQQLAAYLQTLTNGPYDISIQINMVANTLGNSLITDSAARAFVPTWWYDNSAFGPTGGSSTAGGQHGGAYWDQTLSNSGDPNSNKGHLTSRFWNTACLADLVSCLSGTYTVLEGLGIHLYRVDTFMEITASWAMQKGGYTSSAFVSALSGTTGSNGFAGNLRNGLVKSLLFARPTFAGSSITDNNPQIIQAFVSNGWSVGDYDTCNEVIPPDLTSTTGRHGSSYLSLAYRGQQTVGGAVITTNFRDLGNDYHCNIGQDEQGNSSSANTAAVPPADIGCGRFEDYLIQMQNLNASHLYMQSQRFKGPRCNTMGTYSGQPANYNYPASGSAVTATNAIAHMVALNVMSVLKKTYPTAPAYQ